MIKIDKIKYWLRKIVKSPYLQFATGIIMLFSSLSGQQGSLYSDLITFNFRIHHGVNFLGMWHIAQSLPNIWDSVDWMFSKFLKD